ncbi:MAG TPA: DUF4325 domain-containing protein [Gammaproteobacteria bacterium]
MPTIVDNGNAIMSEVEAFILDKVPEHPADISRVTQERFGISRQAVSRYLQRLVRNGLLEAQGATRARTYVLATELHTFTYRLGDGLTEDRVWQNDVEPLLNSLPANVVDAWHYAITEMVNNAIDHSAGMALDVAVSRNVREVNVWITDNGIGIFRKIRDALRLDDIRHAVLELSKGKFTTDPARHSGEGIFFTSRVVDEFAILANGLHARHRADDHNDWVFDDEQEDKSNTSIFLTLRNDSVRTVKEVFDRFASEDDDYVFNKTIIPVDLVRYGSERVVSRSQAKRLLVRVDRFSKVVFDFKGVENIGQAFADEIFRVFAGQHPEIELTPINASGDVMKMIRRAQAGARDG